MNELILGWARKVKKRNSKRQNEVNDLYSRKILGSKDEVCDHDTTAYP